MNLSKYSHYKKSSRYSIDLPADSTEHAKMKNKVRQSPQWAELREKIRKEQKTDPITGSRLTKDFNCHHCDMTPEHYDNLTPDHFVGLNKKSHDVVHFFAESKDWREGIKQLTDILERMEELSDGDIHAR